MKGPESEDKEFMLDATGKKEARAVGGEGKASQGKGGSHIVFGQFSVGRNL